MLTITSITEDGTIVERQYDNRRAKFYQNGEQIKISMRNEGEKPMPKASFGGAPRSPGRVIKQVTQDGKDRVAYTIKVQMGLACNYSCSYCKQAIHVNSAAVTNMQDVAAFIERFDSWCDTPKNTHVRIELWGGEPLVYIAKMRKLVAFFRERFENPEIGFITNGSLMSEDIANWALENNVDIALSHDGPTQLVHRSGDPLAEGSESLKWIRYYKDRSRKPLYINGVLSRNFIDPVACYEHALSRLETNFQYGFEGVACIEDEECFDKSSLFTDEDYLRLRTTIRDQLKAGLLAGLSPFNVKHQSLLQEWTNEGFMIYDNTFQKCGMDSPQKIAVDLKGNILICHGDARAIGHVDEIEKASLKSAGTLHWSQRPECRDCPVLNLCRGSCMSLGGNAWYYTCNNDFHFNMGIFEAAFELLFGERIIDIAGNPRPVKMEKVIPIKEVRDAS